MMMTALMLASALPAQTTRKEERKERKELRELNENKEHKSRKEREEEKRAAWRKERAERRAEEAQQDSIAFLAAQKALEEGCFVLEANNVILPNGVTRFVNSNTNFASVCQGEGVVQTAFNGWQFASPNGLGGVTVQGSVGGTSLRTDKDGNLFYQFSINGIAISATGLLTLTQGTNQASLIINPNFSGNNLTMNGYLVPYSQSNVFEGNSL
jgi:hypothetical protein